MTRHDRIGKFTSGKAEKIALLHDEQSSRELNTKVIKRLLPFLMALMFVAYLDRISISYAGPNGMNADLGLTATTFGIAAGIFFAGYIIFEVPSQALLIKFGSRRWLARIMATWGLVQALMAFAPNAQTLIALRFLLGVAEAGFAPAVILYITTWVPKQFRGGAIAMFIAATPIASILGAPIAQLLLNLEFGSVAGWRMLFFVTGLFALAGAAATLYYLTDRPEDAHWLTQSERNYLIAEIARDSARNQNTSHDFLAAFRTPFPWILGIGYFGLAYSAYALTFFLPTMVRGFQQTLNTTFSSTQTILLNATPFVFSMFVMVVVARIADKFDRPGLLTLFSTLIGATGSLLSVYAPGPHILMIGLCMVAAGFMGAMPLYFNLVPKFFAGAAAAASIALVNSVGQIGGLSSPIATGWIIDATGSDRLGWYVTAVVFLVSGVIAVTIDDIARKSRGIHDSHEAH
jgi:MFS family permease